MDWFQIKKGVHQGCILSPCLSNFYVEYTMQNAELDEVQTGRFLEWWEYQTTLPASWEICMQVKKQQLEPDMEQQSMPKLYVKAVYCHPTYLSY